MSLSERIQQINREISATVDSALAELRRDVAERVRASSEEIARHVEALAPRLPSSFLAHEDLSPFAESMAREAAEKAGREASDRAAQETAHQVAAAARGGVADLRDAVQAIDRARSQADILAALLAETKRFADRAAVLLVRGNEMRGWAAQGFGDADAAVRDLAFTPGATGGWSRLPQGSGALRLSAADAGELCSRIEAPLPHEAVLIPLVLRDRIAAGLYADRPNSLPAVEALQLLCYTAAQAIELLPFRERASTATLVAEDGLAAPAFTPPPIPAASPAPAPAAQAAAPPEEALATARIEAVAAPAPMVEEAREIEIEAEPEPPVEALVEAPAPWEPAPAMSEAASATEVSELTEVEAAPEPAAEPYAEPEIEALPEVDLEPEPAPVAPPPLPEPPAYSPAATVYQPIPREALLPQEPAAPEPSAATTRLTTPMPLPPPEPAISADETVLLQRPVPTGPHAVPPPPSPPAPPPLRSVPPPAPEPTGASDTSSLSGIPEVKPPSGVEGPGWAFAASRVAVSPNEEALHEEARRLARLLVSEIKLYNEEQVEEGRRKKDVYERLKEDIDRSRQMYEERVEPRILKSTDYFYQELVRILAAGDSKALGI